MSDLRSKLTREAYERGFRAALDDLGKACVEERLGGRLVALIDAMNRRTCERRELVERDAAHEIVAISRRDHLDAQEEYDQLRGYAMQLGIVLDALVRKGCVSATFENGLVRVSVRGVDDCGASP